MARKVICILAIVLMLVLSALAEGETGTCDVAPNQRINCGFSGITQKECESRGCCFSNKHRGVPWCFIKQQVNMEEEDECLF